MPKQEKQKPKLSLAGLAQAMEKKPEPRAALLLDAVEEWPQNRDCAVVKIQGLKGRLVIPKKNIVLLE